MELDIFPQGNMRDYYLMVEQGDLVVPVYQSFLS